jgi:nonsense-mediated mRNA decay protein 3
MHCVECGAETEPGPLCRACGALKRRKPRLPEYLDVVACDSCGAVLVDGKWDDAGFASSVERMARGVAEEACEKVGSSFVSVKVTLDEVDERSFLARVLVTSRHGGDTNSDDLEAKVRVQRGTCSTCGRISGYYFESIIQVRAGGREPTAEELASAGEFIQRRVDSMRAKDRNVFVSKLEEVRGGIDAYLSSNQSGKAVSRELADSLGARVTASSELYGQRDGRELYRTTFLVRLPGYWPGAFIVHEGRAAEVGNIGPRRTSLRYLDTWEPASLANKELEGAKLLGGSELVKEGVLLVETNAEVQLLDPDTSKVLEAVKPKGWKRAGETARFVKNEEDVYLL